MHLIVRILVFALLCTRPFIATSTDTGAYCMWQIALIALTLLVHMRFIILQSPDQEKVLFFDIIPPALLIAFGCMILTALLTTITTIYPYGSYQSLYQLLGDFFLMYMIIVFLRTEKLTRRSGGISVVLSALCAPAIAICVYAIHQYVYTLPHSYALIMNQAHEGGDYAFMLDLLSRRRVFFPFFSPNLLAGYIAALMPLVAYFVISQRRVHASLSRRCIWQALILLGLPFVVLLFTKSLAAWLSLAITAGIIIIILGSPYHRPRMLSGTLISAGRITVITALIVAAALIIIRSNSFLPFDQENNSIAQRLLYWRAGANAISAHPITGTGPGTFAVTHLRYKLPGANESIYAHNLFVQTAVESGLPGVISISLLLIVTMGIVMRLLHQADSIKIYCRWLAIFGSMTVFLIHNTVDYSWYTPEVSFMWWCLLGVISAQNTFKKSARSPLATINHFMIHVGLIAALLAASMHYIAAYKAHRLFQHALQGKHSQHYLAQAVTWSPLSDTYRFFLARSLASSAPEMALPHYQALTTLAPANPFWYYELGRFYQQCDLKHRAHKAFEKAHQLYPTDPLFAQLAQ